MKRAMKKAVYAGTFDIFTSGHWWMVEQGLMLFDHLDIAIGVNAGKREPYFTTEERRGMIQGCLDFYLVPPHRASVGVFESQYLVNYARSVGANYLIRGLRSEADFDYERVLRNINGDIDKGITTVFLMPPREIAEVSSSVVKSLIGPDGWEDIVYKYLPGPVLERVLEKERGKRRPDG
jgi:pantetheine-phosphate adenylyltransferase